MYLTGFTLFWSALLNLGLAWTVRYSIGAPRPFLYDARLKPLSDRYAASYGFPSLETHMASVVYGWLAWHSGNPLGYAAAAAAVAFVGFTR